MLKMVKLDMSACQADLLHTLLYFIHQSRRLKPRMPVSVENDSFNACRVAWIKIMENPSADT
jgi:hypothetical protein